MTVADVMHRGVITVPETMPIEELGRFLIEQGISGAPVVDGEGQPVGVVSLADLAAHAAGLDRAREAPFLRDFSSQPLEMPDISHHPEHATAHSLMTTFLVRIDETARLRELVALILATHIHRVFVTQADKLTGVVTTMDLVRVLGEHLDAVD